MQSSFRIFDIHCDKCQTSILAGTDLPLASLYYERADVHFSERRQFLLAGTEEEYIALVVSLAGDADIPDALHAGLRRMMESSPVMDAVGYGASYDDSMSMDRKRREDEEKKDKA